MRLQMTSTAELFLSDALTARAKVEIDHFKIAITAGYTPGNAEQTNRGSVVYTGTPDQIKYIIVSDNEISFILELEHNIGDFAIGNVVIFLKNGANAPLAFLHAALPVTANKYVSSFPNYIVGNKVYLHATVWFPYLTSVMNMSQHTPMYAHAVNYRNEKVMPRPDEGEYEQYVLDEHTEYDGVVYTVKDNLRSIWWGMQFSQYLNDPNQGEIRGGIVPDRHGSPSNMEYKDGGRYRISNETAVKIDGGLGWSPPNEEPVDGSAYPTTSIMLQRPW